MSCVPNIACVSGMSILWISLKLMFSVLCFVVVDCFANVVSVYELSLLFYLTVIYQDVCKNKSVNSIIKSKRITI